MPRSTGSWIPVTCRASSEANHATALRELEHLRRLHAGGHTVRVHRVDPDVVLPLEGIAAAPDARALGRLWARLLDLTIEVSAFVEMVLDARGNLPEYRGGDRLRDLVAATLPRAQEAGLTDPALTVDDVLLAWRMAFGVVVTAPDRSGLRASVDRAVAVAAALTAGRHPDPIRT